MAEALIRARGGVAMPASASASSVVPFTRLSRIARLWASVQRCATDAPARCTTASAPSRAAESIRRASGFQAKSPAARGARVIRRTAWPPARSAATRAEPIRPVAPVIAIVSGGRFAACVVVPPRGAVIGGVAPFGCSRFPRRCLRSSARQPFPPLRPDRLASDSTPGGNRHYRVTRTGFGETATLTTSLLTPEPPSASTSPAFNPATARRTRRGGSRRRRSRRSRSHSRTHRASVTRPRSRSRRRAPRARCARAAPASALGVRPNGPSRPRARCHSGR